MNYYAQKVVWITGASSGIGLALAQELLTFDAVLVLSGRNVDVLTTFKESNPNKSIVIVPFDVTEKEQHQRVVNQIINTFGRIDMAFLNAGIGAHGTKKLGDHDEFDSETLEAVFNVNLFAVAYSIKVLLPIFKAQKSGHVIATASLASFFALPHAAAYSASKAALRSMMRSLAIAYQDIMTVTILYPGFVTTRMTKHIKKMPQVMSAEKAAKIIVKGIAKKKAEIAFPFFTSLLSKITGRVPLKWFKYFQDPRLKQ